MNSVFMLTSPSRVATRGKALSVCSVLTGDESIALPLKMSTLLDKDMGAPSAHRFRNAGSAVPEQVVPPDSAPRRLSSSSTRGHSELVLSGNKYTLGVCTWAAHLRY